MTHEKSPCPKSGLQEIQGIEIESGLLADENIHMGIISDSGGPLNHSVVMAGCAAPRWARRKRPCPLFATFWQKVDLALCLDLS
jgi:hypothetical protein